MRVYLLLLVVVLIALVPSPVTGKNKNKRRKPKPTKDPKPKQPKVIPFKPIDLNKIHDNLDDLEHLQDKGHDILDDIKDIQVHIKRDLWKATEGEQDLGTKLSKAAKSVDSAFKDSKDALKNQDEILDNQEKIVHSIVGNHQETRKVISKAEDNIRKDLSRVHQNQNQILHKIKDGKNKAQSQFVDHLGLQKTSAQHLHDLQKHLHESAADNAHGQEKIVDNIHDLQSDLQKSLKNVDDAQDATLRALDRSQDSVEKRIDNALDRQGTIHKAIKDGQTAVSNDIDGLQKEQRKVQEQVLGIREDVLNGLDKVKSEDAQTQHILDKCRSGGCDTSKTESFIAQITKQIISDEKTIEGDIVGIHNTQSKVQDGIGSSTQSTLKELSKRTSGTLQELKSVQNELDAFLRSIEITFRDIAKEVSTIEKTQEDAEHKLKKIVEAFEALSLLNKDTPGKKGGNKFDS